MYYMCIEHGRHLTHNSHLKSKLIWSVGNMLSNQLFGILNIVAVGLTCKLLQQQATGNKDNIFRGLTAIFFS